eukprot:TRINITY_DN61394_c0_g1_i1.p1 TRINITY_DN61394_c0_g1~~TRINITY_DN61394_c0_g1_i1.p1  ORF type:complete len:306 (+),score=47.95 TRINITY_DN61394_c0_g1_i1:24-920(+)
MASARQLTVLEDSLVGASCGALEVLIMQPLVYWKTELQQQRFTLARALNPRFAYRGVWVSAGSCAPITAIQFGANGACLRVLAGSSTEPCVAAQISSGMLAGMASALVQSPCQLVEINQQKHGGNMVAMARRIYQNYGGLGFRIGYSMTAVREGIFCCGYIAALPMLRQSLRQRWGLPDSAATAVAGMCAGTASAILSHPADTIKTRIQGSLFQEAGATSLPNQRRRALGVGTALAEMRVSGSLLAQCYGGAAPRIIRIISCGFIYDALRRSFEAIVRGVDRDWSEQIKAPSPLGLKA